VKARSASLRRSLAQEAGGARNRVQHKAGEPRRALQRVSANLERAGSSGGAAVGIESQQEKSGAADVPPWRVVAGDFRGALDSSERSGAAGQSTADCAVRAGRAGLKPILFT